MERKFILTKRQLAAKVVTESKKDNLRVITPTSRLYKYFVLLSGDILQYMESCGVDFSFNNISEYDYFKIFMYFMSLYSEEVVPTYHCPYIIIGQDCQSIICSQCNIRDCEPPCKISCFNHIEIIDVREQDVEMSGFDLITDECVEANEDSGINESFVNTRFLAIENIIRSCDVSSIQSRNLEVGSVRSVVQDQDTIVLQFARLLDSCIEYMHIPVPYDGLNIGARRCQRIRNALVGERTKPYRLCGDPGELSFVFRAFRQIGLDHQFSSCHWKRGYRPSDPRLLDKDFTHLSPIIYGCTLEYQDNLYYNVYSKRFAYNNSGNLDAIAFGLWNHYHLAHDTWIPELILSCKPTVKMKLIGPQSCLLSPDECLSSS